MPGKLTERLDLPKCVRLDEVLRAKLNVVKSLRGRNLAMQVREAIRRGVDQEFGELGKEAIDRLWREMQANQQAGAPCRKTPGIGGESRQKGVA